jgi:hypothetical protein
MKKKATPKAKGLKNTILQKLIDCWFREGFKGEGSSPILEHKWTNLPNFRPVDLAWPALKVCVEVDGFGFGHQSIKGRIQDNEKQNALVLEGWYVLRYTTAQLNSREKRSQAVWEIKDLLSKADRDKRRKDSQWI